jgi:drug/metabolite transporter (DMT)-like permease
VRRISAAEGMLLATVTIWAFNFTVTRYAVTHGFQPLAYSALRFTAAALVVSGITYRWEGSLRFQRRHALFLAGAAFVGIYLNSIGFMYAIDLTNASTVALIFGSLPIVTAIVAYAFGVERLHRRFWIAAAISFFGVALVAVGSASGVSGNWLGNLLALLGAVTWGFYSVAIVPLLRRYSVWRISAGALAFGAVPLVITGIPQLLDQDWDLEPLVWAGFAFAVLGPLVLTNFLWFTAIERVGPSRATLVTNLQPFLAAVFAVVLLSEELTWLQVAGGLTIGLALVLARRRPALESA